LYAFGRTLQFLGLLVTGIGFFWGILQGNTRGELTLLAVGAGLFFGGRMVEKRGGGR
jgi:hypothetical protein